MMSSLPVILNIHHSPTMMYNIRMSSLPVILNIHHSPTISTISMVDHMLNPTIRKSNSVLSLNITSLITSSNLTKVSVVLVIMYSILEMEGVRSFIIASSMSSSTDHSNTSMSSSNTNSCRFSICNSKRRHQDTNVDLHTASMIVLTILLLHV